MSDRESALSPAEAEYEERLARVLGDDYELRSLIGRGGFGAVYAGWDRRLERDIAVKALRHDLFPTPDVLARFEREAKAVAKLRHSNIVPVYTVGDGEGIAYMIMPLVQGENLRRRMDREGPLPEDEVIRITVAVAGALEAAHRQGFVHRDVKPENVLLEGEQAQVLLTDFGIARVATSEEAGLTGTGMIVGSPSYMSPEQARGEPDIDHRSDLYQLGAVAYEMLTGRLPFAARSLHELLYRHVTEEPKPIEALAQVSDRMRSVVTGCLAMSPADRIGSAREVVERLSSSVTSDAGGEMHSPGDRDATRGLGTRATLAAFALGYLSLVLSWFGAVASEVRDTGERGEGFGLAVDLLTPFLWLGQALTLAATLVAIWSVGRHYRKHRSLSTALRHAFARPGALFVGSVLGVAVLVTLAHLVFIMPTLQQMAQSAGVALPRSARSIVAASDWFQSWWWLVGGLVLLVLATVRSWNKGAGPSTGETTVVRE